MYSKTSDVPKSSPTPPKEEFDRRKTKAKLRGEACLSCAFYSYSFMRKSGYCAKHRHGKPPKSWCRYYVSIYDQRKADAEALDREWQILLQRTR